MTWVNWQFDAILAAKDEELAMLCQQSRRINHFLTLWGLATVKAILPVAQSVIIRCLHPITGLHHLLAAEPACCKACGPVWWVSHPLEPWFNNLICAMTWDIPDTPKPYVWHLGLHWRSYQWIWMKIRQKARVAIFWCAFRFCPSKFKSEVLPPRGFSTFLHMCNYNVSTRDTSTSH